MKSLQIRLVVFPLAVIVTCALLIVHASVYADDEGSDVSQSTHQSTYTTPDGSSVTRSADRVWDPETETWKRAITTTDEEGNTVTRYTETEKTDEGYTRNSAVIGPEGESVQRSGKGTWDPETKTWKREAVQVGPDGEAVYNEAEVKKSGEGYKRNSTVYDAEGTAATRSATGAWDPETKTWKKGVTKKGADGSTVNRQREFKRRSRSHGEQEDQ